MKIPKLRVFTFLLICVSISCADHADERFELGEYFDRGKMDVFLSNLEEQHFAMGSVAIFKRGQVDYQKSFGYADLGNDIPTTAQTKFRIASITKTFTASIIMQMIEENSLTLSTTLDEFFPELPNSNLITIEHLLKHRSGLFNYTDIQYGSDIVTEPATQRQLIDLFIQNGVAFEPNQRTAYSNTNYIVLGFIIEKIDQKSYSDAVRDRIAVPFGLNSTYNGDIISTANNEALSYDLRFNEWELALETNTTLVNASGSIVSTPLDLNIFYTELFDGNVVSQNSLQLMKETVQGLGMGLRAIPFYDKLGYGHTGHIDGFQSYIVHFPEDKVTVSITLNAVSIPIDDVATGILTIYSNLK